MDTTKIKETISDYCFAEAEFLRDCKDFLRDVLKANNDTYKWDEHFDNYLCVSYTGGNHPEYASTMCSTLYDIFIKDGKIYFTLEDGTMSFDGMLAIDLVEICEWILGKIEDGSED